MKVGVVSFPGSNCDQDALHAFGKIVGVPTVSLWHKSHDLHGCSLVVLPGGFSYGDYLRCGAMAGRSPIMAEVAEHARRGGRVLGICNGFQILTEARLLPGALLANASQKFICDDVRLKTNAEARAPWVHALRGTASFSMPIAHAEGRFTLDAEGLRKVEGEGQVVFRYEKNPNGSLNDIAGISNREGNVVGMMPHPERACETLLGSADGRRVLEALLN